VFCLSYRNVTLTVISAIAIGYVLSASALERANFYAANKDWAGLGDHLHDHEVREEFQWTGYAIGILSAWLPRDLDPEFSTLWANISVLLLCTQALNLRDLRNSLSALNPSGSELAVYWQKLTGINDPEAPTFMVDGWRRLNRVISHVNSENSEDWLLIVIH
jgi:hypothetical protein